MVHDGSQLIGQVGRGQSRWEKACKIAKGTVLCEGKAEVGEEVSGGRWMQDGGRME